MERWNITLPIDPIPSLLSSGNQAIVYLARRHLLKEKVGPIEVLWELPQTSKILRKQQDDGSWIYPGKKGHDPLKTDYNQLETFRNLGVLIEKYNFNIQHSTVRTAAEYLFKSQREDGDFRGIYGSQYAPNYSAAIMEILIKAGYESDSRIEKGLQWLLSIRQIDGGWAAPLRTLGISTSTASESLEPLQPNRSKPFSHLITGMVLRAFAVHPDYRNHTDIEKAANLLLSRFFKSDKYPDRRGASYWESVSFPFWFTDIVSALDSLSRIEFSKDEPQILEAVDWLIGKQMENGLFNLKLLKIKDKDTVFWVCLAICRIFQRLHNNHLR